MFGWKWSDGTWRNGPEPKEQLQPKPKQPPRGFFKYSKPMSRREVALKAGNARMWLEYVLHAGPKPAKEILRLARLERIPQTGLYRAKRYLRIKSVRTGGLASRGKWLWQFPST
jgi:hypothetical protein